jgi:hypothetical protein
MRWSSPCVRVRVFSPKAFTGAALQLSLFNISVSDECHSRARISRANAHVHLRRAQASTREHARMRAFRLYTRACVLPVRAHAQAYWVQRLERAVAQGKDASGFITEQKELRKVRLASALHVQTVLRITCFLLSGKTSEKVTSQNVPYLH